nr:hypothetical protein [Tanacetum cinerariifolium]
PGAHKADDDKLSRACIDEHRHADRLQQRQTADTGEGSEDDAERRNADEHGHTVAKTANVELMTGHGVSPYAPNVRRVVFRCLERSCTVESVYR